MLPRSRDNFLFAYIRRAERAVVAGYTTDEEIGLYACEGASANAVRGWRRKYPAFDLAIRRASLDINVEMAHRMIEFSRQGSESATKFWLERRNTVFMPKQEVQHGHTGALADMLRKRMSDDEAREKGLIIDVEAEAVDSELIGSGYLEAEFDDLGDD
jgi:hypothetical protein